MHVGRVCPAVTYGRTPLYHIVIVLFVAPAVFQSSLIILIIIVIIPYRISRRSFSYTFVAVTLSAVISTLAPPTFLYRYTVIRFTEILAFQSLTSA